MKSSLKFLSLLFTLLIFSETALAESPREQLTQMIKQLQANPGDDALREKIIKLAMKLKPLPSIPQEAERFEGRAQFAFKNAKSPVDYLDAAKEYEKAIAAAPWLPGYYADLCTIYEKAEKYAEAKKSCEFFLASSPSARDASGARKRIAGLEFAMEKANSPEEHAMKQKASEESFLRSIDGARFKKVLDFGGAAIETIYEVRGNSMVATDRLLSIDHSRFEDIGNMSSPGQTRETGRFTWRGGAFVNNDGWLSLIVSPDGSKLTSFVQGAGNNSTRDENFAIRQ